MECKPQLMGKYLSCCFSFGFGRKHQSVAVERMEAMQPLVKTNHFMKNEYHDT